MSSIESRGGWSHWTTTDRALYSDPQTRPDQRAEGVLVVDGGLATELERRGHNIAVSHDDVMQ